MNANAHYQLGLNFYLLNTKKKNIMLAIENFNQSASLGHADAFYFLGRFYGLGDGVSLDFKKAISFYEEGLSLGSAKCGYAIGLLGAVRCWTMACFCSFFIFFNTNSCVIKKTNRISAFCRS